MSLRWLFSLLQQHLHCLCLPCHLFTNRTRPTRETIGQWWEDKSLSSLLTRLSCILMYFHEVGVKCCIIRTKTKCSGNGDLFLQKKYLLLIFPFSLLFKNVRPANLFTSLSHVLFIYFLPSFSTCALISPWSFFKVLCWSNCQTKETRQEKMNIIST